MNADSIRGATVDTPRGRRITFAERIHHYIDTGCPTHKGDDVEITTFKRMLADSGRNRRLEGGEQERLFRSVRREDLRRSRDLMFQCRRHLQTVRKDPSSLHATVYPDTLVST
jgi:hypothetical protein